MQRKRSPWVIASAIYLTISGLWNIGLGIFAVLFYGVLLNLLNAQFMVGLLPAIPTPPWLSLLTPQVGGLLIGGAVIGGIIAILLGVLRLVCAWGLLSYRSWARIMAIALHGIFALLNLIQIVLLVGAGPGFILLPLLLLILNVALMVGLLLPSTAQCFIAVGCGCGCIKSAEPKPGCGCACHPVVPCPPRYDPCPPVYTHPAHAPAVAGVVPATQVAAYGNAGTAPTEFGTPEPQLLAWLVELTGPRSGRQYRLRPHTTVGRNPNCCDVVVDDSKVSGTHARLRFEQGQFVLYDLASTNHTYVNDQLVAQQPLQDGDKIKLGPNTLLSFVRVSA